MLRSDRLIAAGLFAAGAAVLLFRLGQGSLLDFDEATYAEISREIFVYHDIVRLHWDFVPWLNKAPLYQWLTALVFAVFGPGEFTARAVSAVSGAGVVVLTYLVGRTWLDRVPAGAAALLLLLCNLFVRAARFGTSDVLLTFWLYLAVYAYLRSRDRRGWWYLTGAAFGLAFMTKDVASLVGPIAIALAVLIDGRARELRSAAPWLALALAAAIALPWHVAVYAWQGRQFIRSYFEYMVVQRASAQIEGHTGGVAYYPAWVRRGFYPWSYFAVPAALQHVLAEVRARRSAVLALLTAVLLLLYTVVRSKLYWYLDPVLPALALFAAGGGVWLWRRRGLPEILAAAALALLGVWWVPHSLVSIPVALQVAASAVVMAAALAGVLRGRSPAFAVAAGAAAFAVLSALTVTPLYDLPSQPAAYLGPLARTHEGDPMILYVRGADRFPDDNIQHGLVFYSHRRVDSIVGPGRLNLACGRPIDAVMDVRDVPTLPSGDRFSPRASWGRFRLGSLEHDCGP